MRTGLMMAVTAAAFLAGGANSSAQEKIAKIGVLAPVSGKSAAEATEMVNGAQLAVDEINAAGGVAGYKLEIVVGDTQEQTADAVTSAFERLAGDPELNAMVSGYASGSNFEIEMMAEQDMPYIIGGNTAQTRDIIKPDPEGFPTVWSLLPTFDGLETELVPVVDTLQKEGKLKLDNKKVALIASDNPYSKTIMNGLSKSFQEAGWTITSADILPFGEINDWRAFLGKVRQDNPAVVVNTDYLPGNAATFLTQFLEQPTNSLVAIQYAPAIPEFLELTKDKANGIIYYIVGGAIPTPKNPRAMEVVDRYEARYGIKPGLYGVHLYEQVHVYADALAKVGDATDRLAIGKAISETDKQTAVGRIQFDPATHLSIQGNDNIPIQFYQLWDGKRILFYPEQYADGEFRTPPWMK